MARFPGPPNTCPVPPRSAAEFYEDLDTNSCLHIAPTSWVQFGCNAVNVTQSVFTSKGCAGAPMATIPLFPLGCSATPDDPAHPDPRAGPYFTTCGKRAGGALEGGPAGGAAAPLQPLGALPVPNPAAAFVAAAAAALARA